MAIKIKFLKRKINLNPFSVFLGFPQSIQSYAYLTTIFIIKTLRERLLFDSKNIILAASSEVGLFLVIFSVFHID